MSTEHDDEISGAEDIRSFDNASSAVRRFGQSQEFMDALFNPTLRDVPIHGNEDNSTGFRKLFGNSTSTATTPVRKVFPRLELKDPLTGSLLDDSPEGKFKKFFKAAPVPDLRHNPDFPKALDMVTKFSNRVSGRRVHSEAVREAEARVIVSILEAIENTRQDVAAGRL
jgi:hypothetical protein